MTKSERVHHFHFPASSPLVLCTSNCGALFDLCAWREAPRIFGIRHKKKPLHISVLAIAPFIGFAPTAVACLASITDRRCDALVHGEVVTERNSSDCRHFVHYQNDASFVKVSFRGHFTVVRKEAQRLDFRGFCDCSETEIGAVTQI